MFIQCFSSFVQYFISGSQPDCIRRLSHDGCHSSDQFDRTRLWEELLQEIRKDSNHSCHLCRHMAACICNHQPSHLWLWSFRIQVWAIWLGSWSSTVRCEALGRCSYKRLCLWFNNSLSRHLRQVTQKKLKMFINVSLIQLSCVGSLPQEDTWRGKGTGWFHQTILNKLNGCMCERMSDNLTFKKCSLKLNQDKNEIWSERHACDNVAALLCIRHLHCTSSSCSPSWQHLWQQPMDDTFQGEICKHIFWHNVSFWVTYVCHVFLFSQWCSTRGTAGCTQSTSSSTLSLQVNSEKCIAFSLKMSLLELQLCGQTTISQEDLIHQLLRLNYLPIDREGAIQEMNNNFHKLLPMQNNRRHHHHCKLNSGLMRSCIGFYISYCI